MDTYTRAHAQPPGSSSQDPTPRSPVAKPHILGEVEFGETNEVLYVNGKVFSLAQEWLPENQARTACSGSPALAPAPAQCLPSACPVPAPAPAPAPAPFVPPRPLVGLRPACSLGSLEPLPNTINLFMSGWCSGLVVCPQNKDPRVHLSLPSGWGPLHRTG